MNGDVVRRMKKVKMASGQSLKSIALKLYKRDQSSSLTLA
jgi:hypothetical protein